MKKKNRFNKILNSVQIVLIASIIVSGFTQATSVRGATFTVTTTADSGAGSLRQAILDSNAACPVGGNIISFNIPSSTTAAVGNGAGKVVSGASAYYRIVVTSSLPAITCAGTRVDGTTQADTNTGMSGAGGVVGYDDVALPTVNKPEIEITQNFPQPVTKSYGLEIKANNITIKGLSIYGFGAPTQSANIGAGTAGFTGAVIENNFIGSRADNFADPGVSLRGQGNGIYLEGHSGASVKNNLIGFNHLTGVFLTGATIDNNIIEGNEIRDNNRNQYIIGPGIAVTESTTANNLIIKNNLITGQDATAGGSAGDPFADLGIELTTPGSGNVLIENNSVTKNGSGMVLAGGTNGTIQKNIIYENDSRGIMVYGGKFKITKNAFFDNTNSLAIDNLADGDTTDVTLNDSGDVDSGGNAKLNFPVLSKAQISGTNLLVEGYARPGNAIEFYVSDPDPSGYGEGLDYLISKTEGAVDDTDSGTGSYGPASVLAVSSGSDNTNKFAFSIPLASLATSLTSGDKLTTIAIDALGNTSEFSGSVSLTPAVVNTVIANNDSATTNVNTPVVINVTSNDSDPQGDSFSLTAPLSNLTTTNGVVVCTGAGSCTYTPKNNYTGVDTFVYTITDSKGATATATVTITINAPVVNNPPPAANSVNAVDDSAVTNVNTPVSISVLLNDNDPQGDTFTLQTPTSTQTQNGSVVCNSNGICNYTPKNNYIGVDTFNYSIIDSKGATDTALVTITIRSVTPPTASKGVIAGHVFYDNNNNGVEDDGDLPGSGLIIKISGGSILQLTTNSEGDYSSEVNDGTYRVEAVAPAGFVVTTEATSGYLVQNLSVVNGEDDAASDIGLYKSKEEKKEVVITEKPRELVKTASNIIVDYKLSLSLLVLLFALQFTKILVAKLR